MPTQNKEKYISTDSKIDLHFQAYAIMSSMILLSEMETDPKSVSATQNSY